ncbi:hypothetical protein AALP_AA5G211200 [Arabis alpina]|uniref:Uncharacterized protein n=1 Tax=Arabis alpina TaxID=50452 RepID=A0A087GYH1_ARAAL|nr:hypothetical protein AALP_AA5G211200 [Arabis alpina]
MIEKGVPVVKTGWVSTGYWWWWRTDVGSPSPAMVTERIRRWWLEPSSPSRRIHASKCL